MIGLVSVLVGLVVLLAGWTFTKQVTADAASWSLLMEPSGKGSSRPVRIRRPPLWARLMPPALEAAVYRWRRSRLKGPDSLAQQLVYARMDDQISPEQFLFLQVLAPLGLFTMLLLIYFMEPTSFRLVLAFAGLIVGSATPGHWLKQAVRRQQKAIRRDLPSVLTTLGVLLDAGLNLVPALEEVTKRKKGSLSGVLEDALRQVSLGSPLQDALQEAADRCGVQEFSLFVSALNQTLDKGASGISDAVRSQSRQIWELRQQQVQEIGQEMAQDLFLILLVLAFPAIALFLLGPVGLSLSDTFFK